MQLKHFDFVDSIVEIGSYAFARVPLRPDISGSFKFPKNLKIILDYAFNRAFYID